MSRDQAATNNGNVTRQAPATDRGVPDRFQRKAVRNNEEDDVPRNLRTRAEIENDVRRLGWWYQCFELLGGVMTSPGRPPAYYPETRWKLLEPFVPEDLTGKTVLDVGGNAGYFSLQMARRGAKRCTLIEPFEEFAAQARYVAGAFACPIDVIVEDVHTWCLTNDARFDYVVFLGLFYHLKYPGIVLDRLAEMTGELMLFQSHVVGEETLTYEPRGDYKPGEDDDVLKDQLFPRMAFIENLYNGDPTNWWVPNATALEPLVRSAGMKVVARPHPQLLVAKPENVPGKVVLNQKLVFPKYRKPNGATHPGPQQVDPELWDRLIRERDAS
jgi:tRNA (mo5U34)-methyltransferase